MERRGFLASGAAAVGALALPAKEENKQFAKLVEINRQMGTSFNFKIDDIDFAVSPHEHDEVAEREWEVSAQFYTATNEKRVARLAAGNFEIVCHGSVGFTNRVIADDKLVQTVEKMYGQALAARKSLSVTLNQAWDAIA